MKIKGIVLSRENTEVHEQKLDSQALPYLLCCDPLMPVPLLFGAQRSSYAAALGLIEEAFAKTLNTLPITEQLIAQAFKNANSRLLTHFQNSSQKFAISVLLICPTEQTTFVATAGDLRLYEVEGDTLQLRLVDPIADDLARDLEMSQRGLLVPNALGLQPTVQPQIQQLSAHLAHQLVVMSYGSYSAFSPEQLSRFSPAAKELKTQLLQPRFGDHLISLWQIGLEAAPQRFEAPEKLLEKNLPDLHVLRKRHRLITYTLSAAMCAFLIAAGFQFFHSNHKAAPENITLQQPVQPQALPIAQQEQETALESLRAQLAAQTQHMAAQAQRIAELERAIQPTTADETVAQLRLALEQEKMISSQQEELLATEKSANQELLQRLAALQIEKAGLAQEREQLSNSLSSAQVDYSFIQKTQGELAQQLNQFSTLLEERDQLQQKVAQTEAALQSSNEEKARLEERLAALQTAQADREAPAQSTPAAEPQQRLAELLQNIESQKQMLQELETARHALVSEFHALKTDKEVKTHIVATGETLSEISTKYYGSAKHWKMLLEANQERIADANRLRVGTPLIIPSL